MTPPESSPNRDDASRILTEVFGAAVDELERFPTGLAHYVYAARLAGGRRVVVRLTRRDQAGEFAGALYWYERLKPLDIPLPELLYEDIAGNRHGFPVMLMERLPGTDLGHVYPALSDNQKRYIAAWVVDLQRRTATLPPGPGYGYAHAYDDPALLPTWRAVLLGSLDRSRRRIASAGVVDTGVVDRVESLLAGFDGYLRKIGPVPFLHDTTTKNVLIDDHGSGAPSASGIVDVDSICFGDPLFTPSLTRMALLAHGHDTAYVDHWERHLNLSAEQRRASLLYTAIHCAAFLSELGQPFNNEAAPPVDTEYHGHLLGVLDELLKAIG